MHRFYKISFSPLLTSISFAFLSSFLAFADIFLIKKFFVYTRQSRISSAFFENINFLTFIHVTPQFESGSNVYVMYMWPVLVLLELDSGAIRYEYKISKKKETSIIRIY